MSSIIKRKHEDDKNSDVNNITSEKDDINKYIIMMKSSSLSSSEKKSCKKNKKIKIMEDNIEGNEGIKYDYEVDPADHCETPVEAYRDISSILMHIAKELNKTKDTLMIYDPFYCEGSVIERFKSLGTIFTFLYVYI